MPPADGEIRRVPYPYRAMLAVCSDLDETPDRHVYREIQRYLNTTQSTAMGTGVGLEVGNTIYFDMPPDQFSYWNTDEQGREMVLAMIESGHIDCLHSFGDFADTRDHAVRALDAISRTARRINVWVDHAIAPSNFGADIMRGRGDVPGDRVYHADLTSSYGVHYVWRGRVTSVIGQDRPGSLAGVFSPAHPVMSARTVAKEAVKNVLARRGHTKYAMHAGNRLMRPVTLRDGRPMIEFMRCNPYWGGVEKSDTADGVATALTPRSLDRLVSREGVCVFYTHLGKVSDPHVPFGPATRRTFEHMAMLQTAGHLLVATTRRLLGYRRAASVVSVDLGITPDGRTMIDLQVPSSETPPLATSDLDGLTIYHRRANEARVRLNGCEIEQVQRNPVDHAGAASVSLPWPRLEFPSC